MCRSLLQILGLQFCKRETSFQVFYLNFTNALEQLFTWLPLVGLS